MLWLIADIAHCDVTRLHPAAAPLVALCSLGAMGFAALSGVVVYTRPAGMTPHALQVPMALIALMAIFFVLPAIAFAFAWWMPVNANASDLFRGYVVFGSVALPQLAGTMALVAAYFWSPQAKSRNFAALWPLAAWSGCTVVYVVMMTAVQIPHCVS